MGVEDVYAQVVRVNLDLDVVRQDGQDLHAGKRGLAALLGVRGRDAHQAVHALLGAKHAIGVLAAHREHGAVEANDLARLGVVDGDGPAAAVAVALVHAEEHLAPVLRLKASLARRHRYDGVAVV